jgi:hypothetical protein
MILSLTRSIWRLAIQMMDRHRAAQLNRVRRITHYGLAAME